VIPVLTLLAQSSSDITGAAAASTGLAAFALFWTIFWIGFGLIYVVFFIWWIFLLMDLLKREWPEKNTWLIIMILGLVLGFVWLADLLYYFMVVKKSKGGGTAQTPTQAPPQQPQQ
jgi:Kef-type K+ transport system membrane component KefB